MDTAERIPDTGIQWHNTSLSPAKMHNFYAHTYNELVFRTVEERFGKGEAVLFARAATAGTQRFPLHWGGDCESTFEAMAESLRGGLSLALSGFAYWSVDIGGFEGNPEPAVYKRWVQFGLLCSHSRLHGSNSYRVPWTIDDESSDVLKIFTGIKCRLMPYLYALSMAATTTGTPVSVRAMFLEFPDDPTAWFLDRQYMLGDSLLVAPVFSATSDVSFYLPAGRWTCWFSGKTVVGPRWVKETHSFLTCPLYVREGSILVLGPKGETRVVYDYAADVEIRCFAPSEGGVWRNARLVGNDGTDKGVLQVVQGKLKIPIAVRGAWSVALDGEVKAGANDQRAAKEGVWVVNLE